MTSLNGYIRLIRPSNAIICALSVLTGAISGDAPFRRLGELFVAIISRGFWNMPVWQWRTVLAAVSATLILAAGNVFNDVRDIDCDRINAPDRPIPAKKVSSTGATMLAVLLALAGISISLPLGYEAIAVACAATVVLAWYDMQLKRVPFAGNGAVALLGGFAFIYGGIAGHTVMYSLIPAAFATLLHLGRELIKDGADVEGDSAARIATVATVWGVNTAARLAALVFTLLIPLILLPYVLGWFGMVYLTVIVLAVLPVLGYCIVRCLGKPAPESLADLAVVLKAIMPMGLLAVLAGFQWS